ncbi:MAG: sulfatase [Kofleriaceae bacterium]
MSSHPADHAPPSLHAKGDPVCAGCDMRLAITLGCAVVLPPRAVTRHVASLALVVLASACGDKKEAGKDASATKDAAVPADATLADAVALTADAEPAPGRTEHAVYDLVDNRHAAHRMVAGDLVLDASGVAFARYTRFGVPVRRWRYGQVLDGQRVAVPDKLALLEVPLTVEQARTSTQLSMRVYASTEMVVELKANGRKASKDSRVDLAQGWQTVAFAIDAGRFFVGENQLVLESRTAKKKDKDKKADPDKKADKDPKGKKAKKSDPQLGVQWIRVGDPRPLDDRDPRVAAVFDPAAHAIALDKDETLTWFVSLPDGAHLVSDVTPGCSIEVRARPSADAFAGGALAGTGARVDLTAMGGKVVALTLTARDCDRATLIRPHITLQGEAPAPLAKAPPPKYIVLWVMDALRADRVPTFTPGARAQTPNFDELAKTSAVFRQYYVQGNESQTSHSSVWTGVYPAVHNVRMAGVGGAWSIDKDFDVIANTLSTVGTMMTTAVTGNGFVNDSGGYARGFKEFRNMMREKGVINGVIYGAAIVDAALGQLDKARTEPTYLFLGTIDTHGPWIARKPWIDIYSPGRYDGPFKEYGTAKDLGFKPGSMGCSIIPPPADIERLKAIYDSAISYQDKQLGRFIEQLRTWGIWDETMLIITADHGEEFFEDRRCGHGGSLRDTLIRVPLLVHDPSRFPGGTVVDEGAEGVDVFPTIVDALGLDVPAQIQGHSLAPLAQGRGRGWASPSYASMYEYAHAMRIGRWKIRVPKTGVPIIGDMVDDPGEMKEFSAQRPVERRMLTDNIGLFLALRAQWNKNPWGVVTNVTPEGAKALDEASVP